jgi:acetylornithine deacetylase/succinyl-diaminopimelate desuccinylase-like protein
VVVRGPSHDLHSGSYGGVVHNPIHLVGSIVGALHDRDGRVQIPGFYDDVRPLTQTEIEIVEECEPHLQDEGRVESGAPAFWGEAIARYAVRATALPTCDVNGIWGGYQGPGTKTIIPARAGFKVSMRLVADQNPQTVLQQFAEYVRSFACETLEIDITAGPGSWPVAMLSEGPEIEALQQAFTATWGKQALRYREGGSVPIMGMLQRTLGVPIMDFALAVGGNAHSPNEFVTLDYFYRGIDTAIYFYHYLAEHVRKAPEALV